MRGKVLWALGRLFFCCVLLGFSFSPGIAEEDDEEPRTKWQKIRDKALNETRNPGWQERAEKSCGLPPQNRLTLTYIKLAFPTLWCQVARAAWALRKKLVRYAKARHVKGFEKLLQYPVRVALCETTDYWKKPAKAWEEFLIHNAEEFKKIFPHIFAAGFEEDLATSLYSFNVGRACDEHPEKECLEGGLPGENYSFRVQMKHFPGRTVMKIKKIRVRCEDFWHTLWKIRKVLGREGYEGKLAQKKVYPVCPGAKYVMDQDDLKKWQKYFGDEACEVAAAVEAFWDKLRLIVLTKDAKRFAALWEKPFHFWLHHNDTRDLEKGWTITDPEEIRRVFPILFNAERRYYFRERTNGHFIVSSKNAGRFYVDDEVYVKVKRLTFKGSVCYKWHVSLDYIKFSSDNHSFFDDIGRIRYELNKIRHSKNPRSTPQPGSL